MTPEQASIANHVVDTRRVLFGECDPAGVMYTPRICEYVVEAALKFVSTSLGEPFERYLFAKSLTAPARNLNVDFLQPVTWDDDIELRAGLLEIRTHAYCVQVTAFNNDDCPVFSGKITQVCVSIQTKKPAPIPERLRTALVNGST